MNKTPTTLIIMDGFGLRSEKQGNAVANARTPVLDGLFETCAHTTLSASGLDVGLPAGQMGNSEVGHTNIGGGRVVYQDLPRISRAIEDGSFFENSAYCAAMDAAKEKGSSLHLYGLLSDGGVHSHTTHLWALLEMAKRRGVEKVYIHAFLDGRDVSPTSGKGFVAETVEKCREIGVGKIATVMGRYYAMDRDKRWDRVEQAYDAMVYGEGIQNSDPVDAVALMGNLLDNAIEGAETTPDGEDRFIRVTIRPFNQGFVLIQVENSFLGPLRERRGRLLSTKDPGSRGYGMRSIAQIAEKAGGSMEYEAEGGRFTVTVMLGTLARAEE